MLIFVKHYFKKNISLSESKCDDFVNLRASALPDLVLDLRPVEMAWSVIGNLTV